MTAVSFPSDAYIWSCQDIEQLKRWLLANRRVQSDLQLATANLLNVLAPMQEALKQQLPVHVRNMQAAMGIVLRDTPQPAAADPK
jgi:hypothetical protein